MALDEAERNRLLRELTKELREENLAVFVGAGLSVPAGFVNWNELLGPIAEELKLDISREFDLVSLAQYYTNEHQGNRGKLNQLLIDEFCRDAQITENHEILARLPISTYWTTNYDKLIEKALEQAGKIADVKYAKKQLVYTKRKRDAIVYKMHGDADHPSEAVLIKDDYEKYHIDREPFLDALKGDLISKALLFLGFSFTDPNLDYILSRVRVSFDKDQRQHSCILRTVKQEAGETQADYEYRKRKQELFVQDLLRFGIKSYLVDEFSEIMDLLKDVEKQYRRNTVFISGAAHDYAPHDKEAAIRFVYDLSQDIVKTGLKIVSGFGLGVGSAVITGALEHIYKSGRTLATDQLIMRPFPQSHGGQGDLSKLWTAHRKDMAAHAGIALFLFGNKIQDGNVVLSGGMREEFEIAKERGLFLLPVGATGYMARDLWNEVNARFDELNPGAFQQVRERFVQLGDETADFAKLRSDIMAILTMLAK